MSCLLAASPQSVPAWAWGAIILLLGAVCSVGWWAIKRWIKSVDEKLKLIDISMKNVDDTFDSLPCVAEAKKLRFSQRGNSSTHPFPIQCPSGEESSS